MIFRSVPALVCVFAVAACSPAPAEFVPLAGHPACEGDNGYAAVLGGAKTFLWRGEDLKAVRQAYKMDPAAFEPLLQMADAALLHARYSVTDKPVRTGNAGLHDYVSLGTYWWPNPDTPDHLPYVRRDGAENPERNEDRYDIDRLERFSTDVQALAFAYYLTGERRYAVKAASFLRAWFLDPATRMNPNLEYTQSIPGVSQGRATGIIDTRRLIGVVDAIGIVTPSGELSKTDIDGLHGWFEDYTDWLLQSEHGRKEKAAKNNHGSWYDAQVMSFGLFTGRIDLVRQVAGEAATIRVAAQTKDTGEMPHELARARTFFYSLYGTQALMDVATLSECVGVDLWTYRKAGSGSIRDSVRLLASYADGRKKWVLPEPKFAANRPLFHDVLSRAASAYGENSFRKADEAVIRRLPVRAELLLPPISEFVALETSAPHRMVEGS